MRTYNETDKNKDKDKTNLVIITKTIINTVNKANIFEKKQMGQQIEQ